METEIQVTLNLSGDLTRLALSPEDIVWVKLSGEYSEAHGMHSIALRLRKMLKDAGHDNQVIVSDSRMEILIVTPDP